MYAVELPVHDVKAYRGKRKVIEFLIKWEGYEKDPRLMGAASRIKILRMTIQGGLFSQKIIINFL